MRKTLLITGTAPGPEGVGGILLEGLCRCFPPASLHVAVLAEGVGDSEAATLDQGMTVRRFPDLFPRPSQSRMGRAGRALAGVVARLRWRSSIGSSSANIANWARSQGTEEVWAVLDSPATIQLAAEVAHRLKAPLRVTVWDDVHHLTRYFGFDRLSANALAARFASTVSNSISCAVIGETMKAEYDRLYETKSVIVRHGLSPALRRQHEIDATRPPGIRIGFAGSVTAPSAFQVLLDFLDQAGWVIDGLPVTLRLLGHRFDIKSRVARNIECYGWRSVEETIELLSECNFNYMPQPFEEYAGPLARLSFPTKLVTYLAARRPILIHARPDASLPAFLSGYGFGEWCGELAAPDLGAVVARIVDPFRYPGFLREADRALDEQFSEETFRAQFASFLGVDPASLVQPKR